MRQQNNGRRRQNRGSNRRNFNSNLNGNINKNTVIESLDLTVAKEVQCHN